MPAACKVAGSALGVLNKKRCYSICSCLRLYLLGHEGI